MTEVDVTLTDYALTILCSWFTWRLWKVKSQGDPPGLLWVLFFASIALGSLTGGTVHGFFLNESSWGNRLLWPATLLFIGVTATTGWILAGLLLNGQKYVRFWTILALSLFAIYGWVVIFLSKDFLVAIVNYLPPIVFLLMINSWEYFRSRKKANLIISLGILTSFVAAYIQQAQLNFHHLYFNHNAAYHVVQALALWLIYLGARGLLAEKKGSL